MNIILGKGRITFEKNISPEVIGKVVNRLQEEEEDIHNVHIEGRVSAGLLFEMSGDRRINYDPLRKVLNEFENIKMEAKVKEYIEGETGFGWKSKEVIKNE